jgi:transposase-like protein
VRGGLRGGHSRARELAERLPAAGLGHRTGTIELAIPKLRQCTYYPEWLLERRRRAERALATVVATSYLLGVSTRRVEKLAEPLGVTKLSKSQVSVMAAELDEMVTSFRSDRWTPGRTRSCGPTR